jgi:hypothetical protein
MNNKNGVSQYTENASEKRDRLRMYSGQQNHYVCDLSVTGGADLIIPDEYTNCRWVECDVAGIVKVDYQDDSQNYRVETKYLNAGERWLVPNVTKVYYYYTGSSPLTTTVYRNDGTGPVVGIKLRF